MKKKLSETRKAYLARKHEKKLAHQKEIKENKAKNLEEYGHSKRSLKRLRNIIRKLNKIYNFGYETDIDKFAEKFDEYVSIVKKYYKDIDIKDLSIVDFILGENINV